MKTWVIPDAGTNQVTARIGAELTVVYGVNFSYQCSVDVGDRRPIVSVYDQVGSLKFSVVSSVVLTANQAANFTFFVGLDGQGNAAGSNIQGAWPSVVLDPNDRITIVDGVGTSETDTVFSTSITYQLAKEL